MKLPTMIRQRCLCLAWLTALGLAGCNTQTTDNAATPAVDPAPTPPAHAEHAHGPHDGDVFDLGREHEYHAELVKEAENETVSIYILDEALKPYAIDPNPLTLIVPIEGNPQSFELTPNGEGKTSHFSRADKKLLDGLNRLGDEEGKLRVNIDGSPYTAAISYHGH